ncbi:MAG: hypothetical protein ACR2FV_06985 [Ornithinimicrobium sp.]|jgi:hypothetical protein|uniref:hypothetical protein n=1 Tax=Ornithinimicrobium sp. TaxID=1977084 RepID=UPI003D9BD20F
MAGVVRTTFTNPVFKFGAIALVVAAITIGTAAFEGGNLIGVSLALDAVFGAAPRCGPPSWPCWQPGCWPPAAIASSSGCWSGWWSPWGSSSW